MEVTKNNLVRVTIYGQEYTIKGEADPAYIAHVAHYVNQKMEEVESSASFPLSSLRVAILACMNITDEYFSTKKEKDEIIRSVDEKSKFIIDLIDEKLDES